MGAPHQWVNPLVSKLSIRVKGASLEEVGHFGGAPVQGILSLVPGDFLLAVSWEESSLAPPHPSSRSQTSLAGDNRARRQRLKPEPIQSFPCLRTHLRDSSNTAPIRTSQASGMKTDTIWNCRAKYSLTMPRQVCRSTTCITVVLHSQLQCLHTPTITKQSDSVEGQGISAPEGRREQVYSQLILPKVVGKRKVSVEKGIFPPHSIRKKEFQTEFNFKANVKS